MRQSEFERFVDWANFLKIPAAKAFDLAVKRLDHFGVEGVSVEDRSMSYLNTGDTYSETIVLDGHNLLLTTWGDWYEQAEQAYCEEEDVFRCHYCGEYSCQCGCEESV